MKEVGTDPEPCTVGDTPRAGSTGALTALPVWPQAPNTHSVPNTAAAPPAVRGARSRGGWRGRAKRRKSAPGGGGVPAGAYSNLVLN